MFRSIFALLVFSFFFIMSPIVFFGHFFFRVLANEKQRRHYAYLTSALYGRLYFMVSMTQMRVIGLENIPQNRRDILLVANHQSNMDILLVLGYIPFIKGFVAKKSLGEIFLLRTWMKIIGCFFLDRLNIRSGMEAMKFTIDKIKSNHPMVVFPEGHRSKGGPMGQFKKGSMKMATLPGAIILPLVIEGTYSTLEKPHSFPPKVTLEVLPPIDTALLSKEEKDELHIRLETQIREKVEKHKLFQS